MSEVFKPGTAVANTPADFKYIRNSRLLDNPNITRMPKDEQSWNTFILELQKWIRNETGIFAPTFTGFSADPSTPVVEWSRYGQIVVLEFNFTTGTSDTTAFTISNLPSEITPKYEHYTLVGDMVDSGTALTEPSIVKIGTDNILTFYAGVTVGDTWTGSSTKGFGTAGNSIIYHLRSPDKL